MMPFSQIYRVESISKRDIEFVMSEISYCYEFQDFSLLQTGDGIMFLISNQLLVKYIIYHAFHDREKVFLINTLFIGKEQNISNCDVNKTICFRSHATIHEKGK